MYRNYPKGFYVYAPKCKFKSIDGLISYVCRYLSRPVMAESRILDYDGTFVTFWYQRHNDDVIVIEKIHAYEFISRIIVHIPEHNYRQIRFLSCSNRTLNLSIYNTPLAVANALTRHAGRGLHSFRHGVRHWFGGSTWCLTLGGLGFAETTSLCPDFTS